MKFARRSLHRWKILRVTKVDTIPTENTLVNFVRKNSPSYLGNKFYHLVLSIDLVSSSYRLNNHIESMHSEKLYECTFCSRRFSSIKRLKIHSDKHLIEKTSLPCNGCPKVFRSAANLKKHLVKCENSIRIPHNIDISSTSTSSEYNSVLNLSQSIYHRYGTLNGYSGHTTT